MQRLTVFALFLLFAIFATYTTANLIHDQQVGLPADPCGCYLKRFHPSMIPDCLSNCQKVTKPVIFEEADLEQARQIGYADPCGCYLRRSSPSLIPQCLKSCSIKSGRFEEDEGEVEVEEQQVGLPADPCGCYLKRFHPSMIPKCLSNCQKTPQPRTAVLEEESILVSDPCDCYVKFNSPSLVSRCLASCTLPDNLIFHDDSDQHVNKAPKSSFAQPKLVFANRARVFEQDDEYIQQEEASAPSTCRTTCSKGLCVLSCPKGVHMDEKTQEKANKVINKINKILPTVRSIVKDVQ